LPALVIWSAFLWAPPVRSLLWGSVISLAGLAAAGLTRHLLMTRRVCHWTRQVLISEARDANVSLDCFLAVVDDLPESRLCLMDEIWPVKVELETIRGVLSSEGKLG
jgi:hypothetical protein